MKNPIIFIAIVFTIFTSCQKDNVENSINPSPQNVTPVVISITGNDSVEVNLANRDLQNVCTGETWKSLSGTISLKMEPNKSLKVLGIHDFSFRDVNGTVYQEVYNSDIELIGSDEFQKSYKFIFSPQNSNTNLKFCALAKLILRSNGTYTVSIDIGSLDCH